MQVITNEGRTISIPESMYNELQNDLRGGVWMAQILVNNEYHCIILPENFA